MKQGTALRLSFAVMVVLSVFVGSLALVGVASAQSDDCSFTSDLIGACDAENDDGWGSSISAWATGRVQSLTGWGGNENTAEETATELAELFNKHNETLVNYSNNQTSASYDVLEVTVKQDGDRATKYIVADVNSTSDTYESAQVVDTTDRTVDHDVIISGYCAERAPGIVEDFIDEYAEENEPPKRSYLAKIDGLCGDDLSGSLVDELK